MINVMTSNALQPEMMKNVMYVKVNLYLRYLHPLTTTGWLPIFLLVFLNIKISRGIQKLQRKSNRVDDTAEVNGEHEGNQRSNKRHLKEIRATQLAIGIGKTIVFNKPFYNLFTFLCSGYFRYLELAQNYCFDGRDFQHRLDHQMRGKQRPIHSFPDFLQARCHCSCAHDFKFRG